MTREDNITFWGAKGLWTGMSLDFEEENRLGYGPVTGFEMLSSGSRALATYKLAGCECMWALHLSRKQSAKVVVELQFEAVLGKTRYGILEGRKRAAGPDAICNLKRWTMEVT